MLSIVFSIVFLLGIWAMLFQGLPLRAWSTAFALAYAYVVFSGFLGLAATVAFGGLVSALLVFNSIAPLRRAVVSRPLFQLMKRKLPHMSDTERIAISAGDTWWETQLFRGRPDWAQLMSFECTRLTEAEQRFLDHQCQVVCGMLDDWTVDFSSKDLPAEVWDYLRDQRFFGMLIKKSYGGLEFSAAAQSAIVTKLATRSIALAVTVMVPNSLGPAELLQRYGTEEQRQMWLPRLADGREVPCFALTGPEVGSDAAAMPDMGVVGYGDYQGRQVLGVRVTFSKRWITLAPVATLIGLAFKLQDPECLLGDPAKTDYGITCALVPANHPGVQIGRRHYPGVAFMNGPVSGNDIFLPIEWIIGGARMAGHGWRMLVECLSTGRGISLPALSAASAQTAYRVTGAYSRIRRQFRRPIGEFEGVQEAMGRIAGFTYTMEAMRIMTASAVDRCAPSVVTALTKYHMTEMMRKVVSDSMDILGGRGVQQGPRNPIAASYKAVPVAITVEGANILTRSLMIFGQGAIRCHRYLLPEIEAVKEGNLKAFDKLIWAHAGMIVNRAVRAFTLGLTSARLGMSPVRGITAPYFRQLERMSAALSFASDVAMIALGGELKKRERLSARLGDILSQLYMASCVLKFYHANGEREEDRAHLHWAVRHTLSETAKAFDGFLRNFTNRPLRLFMRWIIFPSGIPYHPVQDALNRRVALQLMSDTALRDRLCSLVVMDESGADPVGRLEKAFHMLLEVEGPYEKFYEASSRGKLTGTTVEERASHAVKLGLIEKDEADRVAAYESIRYDVIRTDDFSERELNGSNKAGAIGSDAVLVEPPKI